MEELFELLSTTTNLVTISVQGIGFDYIVSSKIESSNIVVDGIELVFEGDSEMFISSLLNKVVDIERTEEYIQLSLVAPEARGTTMSVVLSI